jgi:hypothetical protein
MYDVRKALDDVGEHGYDGDVVSYTTTVLTGTDLSQVNELYSRLETYDQVDSELLETLGKVCSHKQRDLDRVLSAAELAAGMSRADNWQRVHGALASQKMSNTPLVEQFRSVPLQSGAGGGNLGTAFTEVSMYYVD